MESEGERQGEQKKTAHNLTDERVQIVGRTQIKTQNENAKLIRRYKGQEFVEMDTTHRINLKNNV